ncbi:MAG: hydroxyacid dehydrogenase [Bdellovibrionaceae bacterium]|nr:hydroxyacid dehydrogenase [Pseudobdellovibrionaceae bacterium]|tara:strand:- start:469 stop:1467 length:999 start_codon:yes stop_codon:yes gene_type:complete
MKKEKVFIFESHSFEKPQLKQSLNRYGLEGVFIEHTLDKQTAILARGCEAVSVFVNSHLDAETLNLLKSNGVKIVALRCAGFNHVDLEAAQSLGIVVVRVPEYSPYAVAEHAVSLLLCLNRKIHRAHHRVRDLNFSLDGFVGFDLHRKTVGVIGAGKIGQVFIQIMKGFGCHVLYSDPEVTLSKEGVEKVSLEFLYQNSDVISLHCPLNKNTHHLISDQAFSLMKEGVILINTGRGALIDTKALISSLKKRKLGGAGLDVYEEEEEVFFSDHSNQCLEDDQLARLLTFPNVLVTSHQGFLTHEALEKIAETTVNSLSLFFSKKQIPAEVLLT